MSVATLLLIIGAILVLTGVVIIGSFTFFLLVIGFVLVLLGALILKILRGVLKIAIVAAIIALGIILFSKYIPQDLQGVDNFSSDRLYCKKDTDCICAGIDQKDNSCYLGNKIYHDKFIINNQTCPDFCSGIAGNLDIKCIKNKCTQVQI